VVVSLIWLALLAAGLLWELRCNLLDRRWVSITRVGAVIGRSRAGRLLLVVAWAFAGWHLFARYTLPR
jgi:hypothetical protein